MEYMFETEYLKVRKFEIGDAKLEFLKRMAMNLLRKNLGRKMTLMVTEC